MENNKFFFLRVIEDFKNYDIIGDIQFNKAEREILYDYFRDKYRNMINTKSYNISDPIFTVALINIGLEYYDGNFWKHIAEVLKIDALKPNHHKYIGMSFFKTMKKYNKEILSDHEIVNSILMHTFISNYYIDDFLEFIFAYYSIDLNRDISKNSYFLDELIKAISVNDNTNRTYLIKRHTSDALKINKELTKKKINKYIKAIDEYFWDKKSIKKVENRIDSQFNLWCRNSENFNLDIKKHSGGGRKNSEKNYKKPYIKCDLENTLFKVVLPEEYIKDKKLEEVRWIIELEKRKINHEVQLLEGVIGFKSEKELIKISKNEIFDKISISLIKGSRTLKVFKIPKEDIKFFDEDGYEVNIDIISPGNIYAFTNYTDEISYKGFVEKTKIDVLNRYYLTLKEDDIITLPNNNVISIGNGLEEGLLKRHLLKDSYSVKNKIKYSIYNSLPNLVINIEEDKIPGTVVRINNKQLKIRKDFLEEINYYENNDKKYYILKLEKVIKSGEGYYDIVIDIPNDRKILNYNIAVLKNFSFYFEDAPYIFVKKGTIGFNKNLDIRNNKNKKLKVENEKRKYNFTIEENQCELDFILLNENEAYEIFVSVPVLKWKTNSKDWILDNPREFWYEDMPDTVMISYPENEIKLSIETDQEKEIYKSLIFSKISTGIIECDLVKFYSWINNDIDKQIIYIDLGYKKIPFIKLRTSSTLLSYHLKGDFINNKIVGEFKIIGKSEYYIDIYYKNQKIIKKRKIINGKLDFNYEIKKGKYTLSLYECEDNYGFGNINYKYINTLKTRVINPMNLNGESIQIKEIIRKNKTKSPLELNFKYYIVNFKKANNNAYKGILIEETKANHIFKKYPVEIEFENLEKIYNAFVRIIDNDGFEETFLYDSKINKLTNEEDKKLEYSSRYRRYEVVFPEDFIYKIEFIDNCKYKDTILEKLKTGEKSDNKVIKWIHTNQ